VCGTIKNYAIFWKIFPHALDVHAQRVLKYNFILIHDFAIIENGKFKDAFVDKGQMMLKKIAKIKNFNNFMLWNFRFLLFLMTCNYNFPQNSITVCSLTTVVMFLVNRMYKCTFTVSLYFKI
jgi:hypothetical protein